MPTRMPSIYALDRFATSDLQRPTIAQTSDLTRIDEHQLALYTADGNPPHVRSCYLRATAITSWTVPLRLLPAAQYYDFAFLAWGIGSIAVTGTVDATGFELLVRNPGTAENARWITTAGIIDSAAGATSGRALQGRNSTSWSYGAQLLTLTIDDVTDECGIAAIATIPIWQPITV
jgi:hypothetical protein